MPDRNESPLTLTHAEAVRRLNETIVQIHEARKVCHQRLERAVLGRDNARALCEAVAAADAYGMGLEALFNTLIELKILHPAAWEESEGGRLQRTMEATVQEMVAESLALVFGLRWPGQDQREAKEE